MNNGLGFVTCSFLDDKTVSISSESNTLPPFNFDKVFNLDTTNNHVYEIFKDTIKDVCDGYNGTIFTYGQSGSGKTHTMYGEIFDENHRGIIPRAIDHLFQIIEESTDDVVFQLKFSILQIYKETIYDLLTGEKDLKVKESPTKGIYVDGISEFFIDNRETFLDLLKLSQDQRIVAGTKLNQYSSRSHTIFMLEVQQTLKKDNITKRGILNMVDLAGTEKVSKTGAVGETLEEAKKINLSLSALGNVIHALTSGSEHIPYRDSKLTRMLQESLGGNYKTTLIVTCSPHSHHLEETISTLKFAQRAKTIKNKVKVNIKLSYEELQKIIAQLKLELEAANKEIDGLRQQLLGGGGCESPSKEPMVRMESMAENRGSLTSNNSITKPRRRAGSMIQIVPKKSSILDVLDENVIGIVSTPLHLLGTNDDEYKTDKFTFDVTKELRDRIKELEEELRVKDNLIKESGLDVLNQSKEIYEKVLKEKIGYSSFTDRDMLKDINEFIKNANRTLGKYDSVLPKDLKNIVSLESISNLFNVQEFDKLKLYNEFCSAFPENGITEYKNNFIIHNLYFYLNLELLDNYNKFLQNQNENLMGQNNKLFSLMEDLMNSNINLLGNYKHKTAAAKRSSVSHLVPHKRNSINLEGKLAKLLTNKNLNVLKGITQRSSVIMVDQVMPDNNIQTIHSRDSSHYVEDQLPQTARQVDNVHREILSLKEFVMDAYQENEKVKFAFEKALNEYREIIFSGGNLIKSAIFKNEAGLSSGRLNR
jgi:predicted transcriptional regulator